jgi:hypothetical protein
LGPFYLDDARLAARIVAAHHPYRGYWAHVYTIVTGPVVLYLAIRSAATRDLDGSVALYEEGD